MFITALWVLEQEHKAWMWMFPYEGDLSNRETSSAGAGLIVAAVGQTALIGSMPYSFWLINLVMLIYIYARFI